MPLKALFLVCTKANRTLNFLRRNLFFPQQLKVQIPRAASCVTRNYTFEERSMTSILGQLKCEFFKKRKKDNQQILLYNGLKAKARIIANDLIPKTRSCRNNNSMHLLV